MYSDENTFEKIMNRMLSQPELADIDKRVGSVIYNAIAPCALELANAYVMLDVLQEQTYLLSATGKNLDNRCYDYGTKREVATKAQRIGSFKKYQKVNGEFVFDENNQKILVDMDIPEGSRFVVPDNKGITYVYLGEIDGNKILECESAGTGGNDHLGTIFPLTPIQGLVEAKITGTYIYGQDDEDDESLRKKTVEAINNVSFGGNISDYIQKTNEIDGVGNTKVFPAWNRNGGVLLSIVDSQFNPVTQIFMDNVKEKLDPTEYSGQGYGIAPIGHFVTITTPTRATVNVNIDVTLEDGISISNITEEITGYIENYFQNVRKNFGQDSALAIYRARVTEAVLKCKKVLNVTSVLLNDEDVDIVYNDTETINGQTLPYLGEVTIV